MGLFNFFKTSTPGQFTNEKQFQENLQKQITWTPQTLEELKKIGVTDDKELKLEFFFYTNTNSKAEQLANELKMLKYEVDFETVVGNTSVFVITGWTTKMKMDEQIVLQWTKDMAELGYKYDATFDGWGTNPNQE